MVKVGILILFAVCVFFVFGCGGSNGDDETLSVRIESERFTPKVANIQVGDRITWFNSDTRPHQIISGNLMAVSNPQILPPISIGSNNMFIPTNIEANLGDTVRWRNDTGRQFTMDILDDANSVVATLVFGVGQVIGFSSFPTAGEFRFQERNNQFFSGTVTVFGVVPSQINIMFKSQILTSGDTFTVPFNTAGTFPYFGIDPDNPARSSMTGTVIVQ